MSQEVEKNKAFSPQGEGDESPYRMYAVYSSIVFQMLAVIALGFWGGKKLNDYWEVKNNLLTVGLGLSGLGLALYNTVKQLEKINKK